MRCKEFLSVLGRVGEAFNSAISTDEVLARTAETVVEQLRLKACHVLLLSRDQKLLEAVAAHGLSPKFLATGPVQADRSVVDALRGQTVVISDCGSDSRLQYPAAHAEEGLVSALIAPLKTRGQVIGVMRLYTGARHEFSELELEFSEVLASLCTRAVVQAMFQRVQNEVRSAIRASLDQDHVLESIVRVVSEQLRAKGCSIHLVEAEGLKLRSWYGVSRRFSEVLAATPPDGVRKALEGVSSQIYHPGQERPSPFLEEVSREGVSSILYVPMTILEKTIGVLCVYTHHPYEFSEGEIFFMRGIGDQCALTLQHARMYSRLRQSYETLVNDFQFWFEHKARPEGH